MSKLAKELNAKYILEMKNESSDSVMGRLRDLWWQPYLTSIKAVGIDKALDTLDSHMRVNNGDFRAKADAYASLKGHAVGSPKYMQAVSQFVKSNTGKMFERFCGLSMAHALFVSNSDYCLVPFRTDYLELCKAGTLKDFNVEVKLGKTSYPTHIDADLIAFNPDDEHALIYMISVKSTLKDRFHNVPFWNLLRLLSIAEGDSVIAKNEAFLEKVKYVAICSDLAEQQPDFRAESGPRNLLCVDAALLDGAFVTASNAKGLGQDDGITIGAERLAPFYPLSRLFRLLTN